VRSNVLRFDGMEEIAGPASTVSGVLDDEEDVVGAATLRAFIAGFLNDQNESRMRKESEGTDRESREVILGCDSSKLRKAGFRRGP
jgi:hypothetical protein